MSSVTAISPYSAAARSLDAAVRKPGYEMSPLVRHYAGDVQVSDRFKPSYGLQKVTDAQTTFTYDPSKPFAARNGLLASPNTDLLGGKGDGIGLAFNQPITHLYSMTGKSLVDMLA